MSTDDGVVADDYYKRGLLINQELERDARAARAGPRRGRARSTPTAPRALDAAPDAATPRRRRRSRCGSRIRRARAGPQRRRSRADADGAYAGTLDAAAGRAAGSSAVETDAWRLPAVEIAGRPHEVRLGVAARTLTVRRDARRAPNGELEEAAMESTAISRSG